MCPEYRGLVCVLSRLEFTTTIGDYDHTTTTIMPLLHTQTLLQATRLLHQILLNMHVWKLTAEVLRKFSWQCVCYLSCICICICILAYLGASRYISFWILWQKSFQGADTQDSKALVCPVAKESPQDADTQDFESLVRAMARRSSRC